MIPVLLLLAGLVALYFGAEWLVRGGAALALRLGVTPLLAGLTVVAFGTSAPELVVSVTAGLNGQGAIAIGNVVGSNIVNIGLILGLTAVICPLVVQSQLLKFDTPVMVGVSLLFLWFFRDASIERWEAWVFLALLLSYVTINIRLARRQAGALAREFDESVPRPAASPWIDVLLVLAGLALLVVGSRLFVVGAVDLARVFGVSEAVIGLTVVAFGTSLPELASSVVAALRRQPDIAIGNVIGSNIYNILAILGGAGAVAGPLSGQGVSPIDGYAMVAISASLLLVARTGFRVHRWEGLLLLAGYGGYLWYLWP